jgi:uncharacterized repeat protein (TIGR02543 family)
MNKKCIFVILVAFSLILGACFSPWKGDEGTFSIRIGGDDHAGGREATDQADSETSNAFGLTKADRDRLKHTITLSGPSHVQPREDIEYGATEKFSVTPGLWNITIMAFLDGTEYATGSASVDIKPGSNEVVFIPMTPNTYTVTFNSKGGSDVQPVTKLKYGDKVTKPSDPTKSDSEFAGWFKEETLTNEWNFTTDTVTRNITLYANWIGKDEDVYYIVTFIVPDIPIPNIPGISGIPNNPDGFTYRVLSGSTIPASTLSNINRHINYYIDGFLGWYADPKEGEEWNFSKGFTSDTTLYARLKEEEPVNIVDITLKITFAQITDINKPVIQEILYNDDHEVSRVIIELEDPAQYRDINWYIKGVTGDGPVFILDLMNDSYKSEDGNFHVMVEVWTKEGNKPYSQTLSIVTDELPKEGGE